MGLDYSTAGVLRVSMVNYTNVNIGEFPKPISTPVATPAADHLSCVHEDNESIILPEEQAVIFHHTVAQLLFLSTSARIDIQTPVAFLTTTVKNPDESNWGKLKQVPKYIKGSSTLGLRLTAKRHTSS